MPPKKRAKVAAPAAAPEQLAGTNELCAHQLIRVHEALKAIREHPVFQGVQDAKALTVAQGGRQAPWDEKQAERALRGVGDKYKCGANLFWQDWLWLANHRTPLNNGQIKAIQDYALPPLQPPKFFPYEVVVAVEPGATARPESGWPRLSPAEPLFALLFSIQQSIEQKADDGVLKAWKHVLLTASFEIEVVPVGEERYWRASNIREQAAEHGLSVQLSLRQRIYDVAGHKMHKESVAGGTWSAKKVAQAYSEKLKLAQNVERISDAWVDSAITIYARVLSLKPCSELLDWMDQVYMTASPFKYISTLQAIVDRGQTPEGITLALEGLVDGWRMGVLDSSSFAVAKLKDYRNSYVEVVKMKRLVLKHVLEWLDNLQMEGRWKTCLREVFGTFAMVRAKYVPHADGAAQADSAWLVGASEAVVLCADVLYRLLYSPEFDNRYKDAIKARHEVADFVAYPSIKKELEAVEGKVREESKPPPVAASAKAEAKPPAKAQPPARTVEEPELQGFAALQEDDQQHWRQHILNQVRSHVRFVADQKTESDLVQAIRDNPLATIRGDPTGQVLIHYDQKKFGEASTRPDVRGPTLRDAVYGRLVKAVLKARATGDAPATLQPGDIALLLNGGKDGLKSKLLLPWKEGTARDGKKNDEEGEDGAEEEDEGDDDGRPTLAVDHLMLAYTEESLAARKQKVRGVGTLKQCETAYVLSQKKLQLPQRGRKHYAGSSSGDLIHGIVLPSLDGEWHVPWLTKKEAYSKKHIIAVGGRTESEDIPPKVGDRLKNADEPMCFFSQPLELCEEFVHQFYAKLVVDLSPADGKFAYACLRTRTGYVGVTYTEAHAKLLEERLVALLTADMTESGSPLFNSAFAQALNAVQKEKKPKPKPEPKPKPDAKAKPDAKPKPDTKKPKRKPKPKPKAQPAPDQAEDEEEEEEEDDEELWDPLA